MGLPRNGKYYSVNPRRPQAVGMCDLMGIRVNYNELVKQMEFRGTGLVWTGLWVAKRFMDKPNPQNLNPIVRLDPKPLQHPRPYVVQPVVWENQDEFDWESVPYPDWADWS